LGDLRLLGGRRGRVKDSSCSCFGSLAELFFSVFGFEDFDFFSEGEAALEVRLEFLREETKRERERKGGRRW